MPNRRCPQEKFMFRGERFRISLRPGKTCRLGLRTGFPTLIILHGASQTRWFPMTDWNIQSRAHACEACGKGFVDKEAYHTLLFDERAAFRRIDVCQACWQKQYSEGGRERKGFVS